MPQSFLKMPTAHCFLALSQNPVCLCLCHSNCAADLSLSLAVPASEPGRKLLLSSVHGSQTCICLHMSLNCFQNSHLETTGTAEEFNVAGFAGDSSQAPFLVMIRACACCSSLRICPAWLWRWFRPGHMSQ